MVQRSLAGVQWSVHAPSGFICHNCSQLLPSWVEPVGSVLVILQRSPCHLLFQTSEAERVKDLLRQNFLTMGDRICRQLVSEGYFADVFDPRTGLPLQSQAGTLILDDVAIVRSVLGYDVTQQGDCSILVHPNWGSAVYPSTLVSSAKPDRLGEVVRGVIRGNGE